ncbi:MAG: diadenylate cyclase CdaA [Candidatus Saganbacteria bacterium]|nr:diadenylate cyclase CdaA [Candidatus Saganbacteria bacterium]
MPYHFPFEVRWLDLLDVAIVAIILYYVLLWLQGTRAIQLLRGLLILLLIYLFGRGLGLYTINWLFDKFIAVIIVMLIIVFQPELRRALERLGRGRMLSQLGFAPPTRGSWFVRHVIKAVEALSESRIGALIVLERNTGLSDFLESGTILDSMISAEQILSIFSPKSPLHDGAIIIQGDRIAGAKCLLPLSESKLLDKRLGTRHRAAVGITEQTDAFVIVVSEKTGIVSVAENGYLTRGVTKEMLEEKLFSLYKVEPVRFELIPLLFGKKKEK